MKKKTYSNPEIELLNLMGESLLYAVSGTDSGNSRKTRQVETNAPWDNWGN